MVPQYITHFFLAAVSIVVVNSIMVPTGKLTPITPAKPLPAPLTPRNRYTASAPVWERIDEAGSGYTPPVYKYVLWSYVQKYGHHTLIPREEDYYNPNVKTAPQYYYKNEIPYSGKGSYHSYTKSQKYYSPLQFL